MDNYTRGFLREEDLVPSSSMTENVLRMFSPIRIANALAPVAHDQDGNYSLALPSAIADPMESWKGMVDRHRAGIQDDEADVRDAFNVAGSVGLGSFAATPLKPSNALGAMGKGIRAYHGSPYDFDKFDLSKIGTGEGAQAYGHGLYFTEKEPIAEFYRDKLTNVSNFYPSNVKETNTSVETIQNVLKSVQRLKEMEDPPTTINELRESIKDLMAIDKLPKDSLAAFDNLVDAKAILPKGKMYEVNLKAKPEDFLDLDKLLGEQLPNIKEAIQKTQNFLPKNAYDDLGGDYNLLYGNDIQPIQFLSTLEAIGGKPDFGENLLLKQNVKGAKYFNGISRGLLSRDNIENARNYTVFDPEIIEILRKYANPPTSSAVPLSVESNDNNQSQPLRGGFGPRWEQPQNALSY